MEEVVTSGGEGDGAENTPKQQVKTCISLDINHKDMSDILSAIDNIHKVFENGNNMIVRLRVVFNFYGTLALLMYFY